MKKLFLFLVLITFVLEPVFAEIVKIKSLRVYSSDLEGSFPIVIADEFGDYSELTIEFDIQSDSQPNLEIIFRFCDKDWMEYDSYFLKNQGYNIAHNLWFKTLPASIEGADYHYSGTFPNFDVTFPYSGNWIFEIREVGTPGNVYDWGKFYVVKPEVNLLTRISRDRLEDAFITPSFLERTYRISVDFDVPDMIFPQDVSTVDIIENNKLDYPYRIEKDYSDDYNYYETDGNRKFKFVSRSIEPGNEYRITDLRDSRKYFAPVLNAQPEKYEVPRTNMRGFQDKNGRSILKYFEDSEADYLFVNFSLRGMDNIDSKVFLTGSFNNWSVLPEYELSLEDGIYEIDMELKRGSYDYQYVTGEIEDNYVTNISWSNIEGNFWETNNDYHIFLYIRTTEFGGYDKIIGYSKISSGEL